MKAKITQLLIFLLLCAALSYAQQPPLALTPEESAQWAQFAEADKALTDNLRQTAPQARQLSATNTEQATKYLAAMKEIYSAVDLNATQRALWLAKLQAAKRCESCTISEDGKALVPPKPKE